MNAVRNFLRVGSRASKVVAIALCLVLAFALKPALAQQTQEYSLGAGDVLKISVFKNPDLTLEVRVSEAGAISFPLLGAVQVSNLTLPSAEKKIAQLLKDGGYVQNAQVNILVTTEVSNQVSVLGQVNRPGRYPLELAGGHLSGILATAGGIAPTGSDSVIVSGTRNGKPFRHEIDTVLMSMSSDNHDDIALVGGDTVFVNRAPSFYIYGQVQKAGELRLEREMTVMQALASGGGVTGKGTCRGIVIHRRDAGGKVKEISAALDDDVRDGDVIYVKESVF